MFSKFSSLVLAAALLAACSTAHPKIIQANANNPDVEIQPGMATQIEMPDGGRVASVVVGNKDLVSAEHEGDVVTVSGKGGEGETNMIIRSREDGDTKVYQYRVIVRK